MRALIVLNILLLGLILFIQFYAKAPLMLFIVRVFDEVTR